MPVSNALVRVRGFYFRNAPHCWTVHSAAAEIFPYATAIEVARYWRKGNAYLGGFRCVEVEVLCADTLEMCEAKDERRIAEVDAREAEIEARRRKTEEKAAKAKPAAA